MNSSTLYRVVLCGAAALLLVTARTHGEGRSWWNAGSGERMSALSEYANENGALGVLNTSGAVDTKGHPFFEPLGPNGRACVTCHQPANGMSVSAAAIREQWRATGGRDHRRGWNTEYGQLHVQFRPRNTHGSGRCPDNHRGRQE